MTVFDRFPGSTGKINTLPPNVSLKLNCTISRTPAPKKAILLKANIPALNARSVVAVRIRWVVRLRSASLKSTEPNVGRRPMSHTTTHSKPTNRPSIASVAVTPITPNKNGFGARLPTTWKVGLMICPATPPIVTITSTSTASDCRQPVRGMCVSFGRRMMAGRTFTAVNTGATPKTAVTTMPSVKPNRINSG